jgi:hypothetical protein
VTETVTETETATETETETTEHVDLGALFHVRTLLWQCS